MANDKKRGLGRGLSALMADVNETETQSSKTDSATHMIPIEKIFPNPDQPRKTFNESDLDELSASIEERGIIQPLIVRRKMDDFEIVAGERRWRAAQRAKLHEVPVVVRDYDDLDVLEIAIIENIQRADLNPIEEASGYRQLMDKFGHTQEKLAEALGKSRSHIANILRLLQLPDGVISLVQSGELSAGHARALITSADPLGLARHVVKKGLSVRETENLAKRSAPTSVSAETKTKKSAEKDADTRALESDLMAALGMKVSLQHKPGGESGQMTLHYGSLEELDDLCRKLSAT